MYGMIELLTVSLGPSSCTLTSSDLQKYPESLLACIAKLGCSDALADAENSIYSSDPAVFCGQDFDNKADECKEHMPEEPQHAVKKTTLDVGAIALALGSVQLGGSSSSGSSMNIKLDDLHSPVAWPEALSIIPSLYRQVMLCVTCLPCSMPGRTNRQESSTCQDDIAACASCLLGWLHFCFSCCKR